MTTKPSEGLLQPYPQLLQLTPLLHVCLEHKKDPVTCFSSTATEPSQPTYRNVQHYRDVWLPIVAMETVTCVGMDADAIMIHNIPVQLEKWNDVVTGRFRLDYDFCRTRRLQVHP